jgi:hypothetical protein
MDNISAKDFTTDEWKCIQKFSAVAAEAASSKAGITSEEWNMSHLAKSAELNIFIYPKEGLMMHALWIIFFSHLKRLVPSNELKYQNVQSFLESYGGKFDCHTPDDQKLLCETANWMNEMFKYLSARKNKGLAIQMIPKLVEGWNAKYVTGSGQTKATADRVFIFEKEGGVQPAHRGGRMNSSKKSSYSEKSRRSVAKGGDRGGLGFSSSKKKKMKPKSGYKPLQYPSPVHEVVTAQKGSSFCDYDNADTDVDTDASGNTEDLYSHLTLTNVACQHPSNEMNEYFDIFRNIMAVPSSNNLIAEVTQTSHPTLAPTQNPLGTALALGPSNFQPLFDFSLQGGPAPLMIPIVASKRSRDEGWHGPSPLPPPLKRAYSWESDYILSENTDTKERYISNGIENNAIENGVDKNLESKLKAAKHAPPSFLFDEYLISHP